MLEPDSYYDDTEITEEQVQEALEDAGVDPEDYDIDPYVGCGEAPGEGDQTLSLGDFLNQLAGPDGTLSVGQQGEGLFVECFRKDRVVHGVLIRNDKGEIINGTGWVPVTLLDPSQS